MGKAGSDEERHSRIAASAPQTLVKKMLETELSGERRIVTAIFADVVGSTALMETIDPEDWTAIVNVAFDLMSQAVYRYEGTIAQIQGDAMVVFFGAPVAHEDDSERAVRAALDMLSDIQDYREQLKAAEVVDFQIRAGMNTGVVLVGRVGTDLRFEYTALGDAMNVAARMEAAARPGTVLITHDTYRSVSGTFDVQDLGAIPVKGKSEPIRAYEVTGIRATPAPKRGIVGLRSPMVGREADLERLKSLFGKLQEGRGGIAAVIGEPGIGKTRLISEFKAWTMTAAPNLRWIEAQGLSYGRNFPYHVVLDLIRSSIGTTASSKDEEVSEALTSALSSVPEEEGLIAHRILSHLLGLQLEKADVDFVESLDPETLQVRYLGGLKLLVNSLTHAGPLFMLLEDVHWSDAASVSILRRMLALGEPLQILVCITSRPDTDSPGWELVTSAQEIFGSGFAEIRLDTLADDDSRLLMAALLEIESLPKPVRDKLLARAEGNPLFLEELIKVLIDRGVIVREGPRWVATGEVESVEIPDTLRGLLLARIDRLGEEAQRALKVASVIGRRFPARVLEKVLDGTP